MDLWRLSSILWKHKALMFTSVIVGILLAFLALYSVSLPARANGERQRVALERRRFSTYQTQVSFLIDVPGFGVGRTDIPMNKPAEMAPTFAFLATSDAVKSQVARKLGKVKELVTTGAVENSPIFQLVVEGNNPDRVAEVASTYATEIVSYIQQQQSYNNIPNATRLSVRALGRPSIPKKTASRDAEIAGLLFLTPIILAGLLALSLESFARHQSAQRTIDDPDGSGDTTHDSAPVRTEQGKSSWPWTS